MRRLLCNEHFITQTQKLAFMARVNPFTFLQQVRSEVAKVVWPTRNETVVSTIMVFVMVTLASIFFLLADQVIGWLIGFVIGV